MSDQLVVRLYNVRFGDAILVTVPDRNPASGRTKRRRILIDVGNAPTVASPEGGDDSVFRPVVEDILRQLDGQPLDLYVMTHEHLDHVQGLPHAAWKLYPDDFAARLKVRHVWLTASAAPDYYDRFPEAKKKRAALLEMHARLRALLGPQPPPRLFELLANNDPTKTGQCVEFLRGLSPTKTAYLFRGAKLGGRHPFKEAKFEVWAPEEDTSDYYGPFQPLALDGAAVAGAAAAAALPPPPPPGVDVGAFLNLLAARADGVGDNLLAIDQAANNSSLVFALEWRGWRLLFPGDAEVRSWKTMAREEVLKPVHFLKVAHHGSHNGTPAGEIFDAILPASPPDARPRCAAISTWTETYSGIPHPPTDQRLASRATLYSTLDDPAALFFDLEFPG